MENTIEKLTLNQKLMEVRKSLPYFKKGAQGHNYKYVAGVDILIAIQDKMNEHGLLLYPEMAVGAVPEVKLIEEVKQKKIGNEYKEVETHSWLISNRGFYVWEDTETGETKKIQWHFTGEQMDPSRAFGSALTYAERYFLLKFFNVPTDELDPDKFIQAKPYLFNDMFAPNKDKRDLTNDEMEWFKGAIDALPKEQSESTTEWIKLKHTPEAIAQTKKNINVIVDEINNR